MRFAILPLLALFSGLPSLAQVPTARKLPAPLMTAAGAYKLALADIHGEGRTIQSHIRYLWLGNPASAEEREDLEILARFALNSLNTRHATPYVPVSVGGRLLRVDLEALGVSAKAWDDLGRKGSDPNNQPEYYFHRQALVLVEFWPGGADESGHQLARGVYQRRQAKEILTQADWLDTYDAAYLAFYTQSNFPIYDVRWFLAYGLTGRAYYDLAGIGAKLADMQGLAGVDIDGDKVLQGVAVRGAVVRSEVASRNRALRRFPSKFRYGRGYFLQSLDYLSSAGAQDVLTNLLDDRSADANELIWMNPNGLQAYGIVNGKGARVNAADEKIALDRRTAHHDKTIWGGVNRCAACHAQGPILIRDEVRLRATGPLALGTIGHSDEQIEQIKSQYFDADFNGLLRGDQKTYDDAIRGICKGRSAASVSLLLTQHLVEYFDGEVGLQELSLELGYPAETIRRVLEQAQAQTGTQLNHSFVRMLAGGSARRDTLETVWFELASRLGQ